MINIFKITILFILLINFVKCKKCKKYKLNEFEDYDICNNYITVNTEIIDTQYLTSTKTYTLEKTNFFTNTIYLTETIDNEITQLETFNYTNTIYLTNTITDNIISTKTINLTNIEISSSTIIESKIIENTIYLTDIETDFVTETLTTSVITPTCLPDTPNKCLNGCTNLMKDINNCGTCGNICNITNAESYCNDGSCGILNCDVGYTKYNNTCINLNNDVNNCGKYGNICPNGFDCFNGVCSGCAEMVNSNGQTELPGGQYCDIQIGINCPSYCSSIEATYVGFTENLYNACDGGSGTTCFCCMCYNSDYIFNPQTTDNCIQIGNITYGQFIGGGPYYESGSEYIYII